MFSVSVIIPTHKRPKLLKRTIQSVLNQTKLPSEILIIDDAGCKETAEVVKSFNKSLIKYVHNVDGAGASSSRNLGAGLATGDFIAFLDDDDEWLPLKLEKQVTLIEQLDLDACFSQIQIKYENTKLSYATKASMPLDPLVSILQENYIGATISAIVKKSVFQKLEGFDLEYKAREEYDFWIRVVLNGLKIGIVEEPLAVSYRSLENRVRISSNINSYITAIDRLNKKYKDVVKVKLNEKQRTIRKKMQYDFLAAQAASIGLRQESVRYYAKSLITKFSFKSVLGLIVSAISPTLLIKVRAKI